jgi:hypothetical protein
MKCKCGKEATHTFWGLNSCEPKCFECFHTNSNGEFKEPPDYGFKAPENSHVRFLDIENGKEILYDDKGNKTIQPSSMSVTVHFSSEEEEC